MASENQKAWMASESDLMRRAMQNRRLISDVSHLKPILDTLPAGSVVCEVGCGPGGITLDIAQRYPELTVLGIDIDEESIKVSPPIYRPSGLFTDTINQIAKETAKKAGTMNIRFTNGDACCLDKLAAAEGFEALAGGCDLVYSHAVSSMMTAHSNVPCLLFR